MTPEQYTQLYVDLDNSAVIAYPTETVWGLGCNAFAKSAVDQIFTIKGRSETKALSVLVRDIYMAKELAEVSPKVEELKNLTWPGPLTFVLPAKDVVIPSIHGGTGFVGLRCSSHPFVMQLMTKLPFPLITTSANLSGQPPATNKSELGELADKVLVVPWEETSKGQAKSPPSTVIKLDGDEMTLLREGGVSKKELLDYCENLNLNFEG